MHWSGLLVRSTDQIGKECEKLSLQGPWDNFRTYERLRLLTSCRHVVIIGFSWAFNDLPVTALDDSTERQRLCHLEGANYQPLLDCTCLIMDVQVPAVGRAEGCIGGALVIGLMHLCSVNRVQE